MSKRIPLRICLITLGLVLLAFSNNSHADDVISYDEAVRLTESNHSFEKLKRIGVAFHNYHDVFGRFPPAVIRDDKSNKLRSWRVKLLPVIIGRERLLEHGIELRELGVENVSTRDVYTTAINAIGYNTNENWNSPSNIACTLKLARLYRHPLEDPNSVFSGFYAVVGSGTAFDSKQIASYQDYSEKWLSQTMLVAEARRREPWTKPFDISYSPNHAVPVFRGCSKDFLTVSCDGAVHIIPISTDEDSLRAYFTTDVTYNFSIPGIPFRLK